MSHNMESILECLTLEVRGLKDAVAKLTDRLSEAAGLWEPQGYAVQPTLFQVKEKHRGDKVVISCPRDVFTLCKDMKRLTQEQVDVLLLNTKNYVTRRETVFLGTLNSSVIHPREIFALAIKHRAASIILVHNHPSQDTRPSNEDIKATEVIKQNGEMVQIPLLDHVIIGDGFTSLKESGHL